MTTDAAPSLARIVVDVSTDRMTASIQIRDHGDPAAPTADDIAGALKDARITINDAVKKRLEAFLALCDQAELPKEPFVVAEGTAPIEGEDETLEWAPIFEEHLEDWAGDEPVNYYTLNSIVTLDEGMAVGTIHPLEPSKDGVDVLGDRIPAKTKPTSIQLGKTVSRSPGDPNQIVAQSPGKVVLKDFKLWIDEVLTIKGNIDFENGNVDATTDVSITGNVQNNFEVKSAKGVTVGGTIEAARVSVKGNVTVRGGILGRQTGMVRADGSIIAKFCDEANLFAGGDLKITRQVMNCNTHAEGMLLAGHGALIGGHHFARAGVEVATIGSDANVPTRIAIGTHPRMIVEAHKIELSVKKTQAGIEKIRASVQPLIQNIKRLTPAQREQATELLFKADEAEMQVNEKLERRDELLGKTNDALVPFVRVTKVIHPGTTISTGRRVTVFDNELKGPISIEERKIDNVTEFIAVNQLTGSIQTLPSVVIGADELLEGFPSDLSEAPNATAQSSDPSETADDA